ncbi:MAG: CPBP family intramembrane metalloprotease [Lachnospiraceae bacterium]|nr:CPBP family intramembrane metalloprotease [Lachnospiraceae bacterium]
MGLLALVGVPAWLYHIVGGLLYAASAYIMVWLFCTKYLKEDMKIFCIPRCRIQVKWAVMAVLLPVFVSAVYLLLPGNYAVNELDFGTKLAFVTRGIFLAGLGAGVVEEMLFRGLLMNVVIRKCGRAAGILAPSVLFASLHIIGMNFSLLSCVQVMVAGTLVGVMFSLIALEGHSIWNSAVVHAVWNMIIIGGGLVIGTELDEYSICSYVLETRSFLLTGGEFGIESSVVSIIGYLVVSLMALWMIRRGKGTREREI